MCDRIVVLREGRITAELPRAEATQERVLYAMTDAGGTAPGAGGSSGAAAGRDAGAAGLGCAACAMRRELGLVLAMAAVIVPVSIVNPRMLSGANLSALAMDAGLLAIVAAGQMLVVLTRNIDLSVASVIGLAAYVAADLLRSHPELGVAGGILAASGVGLACGLVNGLVVTVGRVPSIVVTLGTLTLFRGLTSLYAGGKQVSADQVPQAWLDLTGASVAGIPGVVLIALATLDRRSASCCARRRSAASSTPSARTRTAPS